MKKFKTVFYLLYVAYFLFAGFVALNYEALVLRWDWDSIDTWVGLLKFVLKMGGLGLILFFIEIIIENVHVATLNRKISSLEVEVLALKSKMYDDSQAAKEAPSEPVELSNDPPQPSDTEKPSE